MSKNHKLISLNLQKCHGGGGDDNNEGEFVVDKNDFQKKDIARRRWGLLAKALKSPISSQPSSPTDEISMRRFSTFELLRTELLRVENVTDCEYINELSPTKPLTFKKRYWYRYYTELNSIYYFIDIGHVSRSLTAADLIGFNNTGNVCVWPSEEALAFYILNNIPKFRGKNVLELGAGMSALAGIIVAKYGQAKRVYLTDGNAIAVDNVRVTLERNQFSCDVKSDVLQWDQNYTETFDVILTADCLFFDEARTDLINTIWNCLTLEGVAYVMAPKRGETLDIFMNKAELKGFRCEKCLIYNDVVWSRHLECLDNPDYNENLHYPVLLLLKKS